MAGDIAISVDSAGTTTSDHVTGTTRKGLDGSTKKALNVFALDTMEHAHYQVHQSNFWTVSHIFNIDASSTGEMLITTGTHKTHIGFGFNGGFDFRWSLLEGITVTSNGTTLTAYNNNRSAPTATLNGWNYAPVGATLGTTIFNEYIPGGIGPHALGGSGGGPVRNGSEWILAANTKYLFRILNLANTTQTASMVFNYYESNGVP